MAENNRKYMAEAWFNNEAEENFKTSFLESLISQWQGHENGFDADTVDGVHAQQIIDSIDDIVQNYVKSFNIGYTNFKANIDNAEYFIGFEAIKLYDNIADGVKEEEKTLPWRLNPIIEDIPNLHQVIKEIYNMLYLGDETTFEEGKSLYYTNKELFNEFQERLSSLESLMESFQTTIGSKITEDGQLNADCVNGIRFYIYNEEQYAELKEDAAKKEDEEFYNALTNDDKKKYDKAYQKLHSPHNVFIIKEKEDLEALGYDNGVFPDTPDLAVIDKFYEFQIASIKVYDENIEEYKYEKWLQYKHEEQTEWHNMVPVKNFISIDDIAPIIKDILVTNDYSLNSDVVEEALMEIEVTEDSEIPLAKYAKDNYLVGGVYDYNTGATPLYKIVGNKKIDGFQYLNLTNLKNILDSDIQDVLGNLNNYKRELQGNPSDNTDNGVIGDLTNRVSVVETNLSRRIGNASNETTLETIDASLTEINSQLNQISTQLSAISRWERYDMLDLERENVCSKNWYNKELGIGALYVDIPLYIKKGTPAGWMRLTKDSKGNVFTYNRVKAVPVSQVIFRTVGLNVDAQLRILPVVDETSSAYKKGMRTGEIIYYNPVNVTKDLTYTLYGSVVYRLYEDGDSYLIQDEVDLFR